jgi:hypothetical protein
MSVLPLGAVLYLRLYFLLRRQFFPVHKNEEIPSLHDGRDTPKKGEFLTAIPEFFLLGECKSWHTRGYLTPLLVIRAVPEKM